MNEAKKYVAGNTLEQFSRIMKLLVSDENAGWKPIDRVLADWDNVFEQSKNEMLEYFYGKLAICVNKKGYSFRKELKKLVKKYGIFATEKITPHFLAMMPESARRADLIELATELYWLDNSLEAAVDLAKLIAWSVSGVKSTKQRGVEPMFDRFGKILSRNLANCEDRRKTIETTAMDDTTEFPLVQYYMLLAFAEREDDEILAFPAASINILPFIRIMVGRATTRNAATSTGKEALNSFLVGEDACDILDLYFDQFVCPNDIDEDENVELDKVVQQMMFNQQFIEMMLQPLVNWLAGCGLSFDDIIAPGNSGLLGYIPIDINDFVTWTTEKGLDVVLPKRTAYQADYNYNSQFKYFDPAVKEIGAGQPLPDGDFKNDLLGWSKNSYSVAFLPDYPEFTPTTLINCEDQVDKPVKINSMLPAQAFFGILLSNMAAQIVELRTKAATPVDNADSGSVSEEKRKAREAQQAAQKTIEKLRKENEALKKQLHDTEKKHKEAAAAEIKRHKANFSAAQEELTNTKRQLRETRAALEEEMMQRIAAELDAPENEPPEPEVEEQLTDEQLADKIREFTKKRKVVVIGGTAYWKNRLSALYPDIEFYNASMKKSDNPSRMKTMTGIDAMVVNCFNTSHRTYIASTSFQREHGIPLFYMPYGQSVNRFNEVMRAVMESDKEENK